MAGGPAELEGVALRATSSGFPGRAEKHQLSASQLPAQFFCLAVEGEGHQEDSGRREPTLRREAPPAGQTSRFPRDGFQNSDLGVNSA